MHEVPPNNFENKSEHIPSKDDVKLVFEKLLDVGKYETMRQLEDEQGLYLWDIKVAKEDGYAEYSYMRKGQYKEGQASATAIHVTFYDDSGFPVGGHSVGKLIDGEWTITP